MDCARARPLLSRRLDGPASDLGASEASALEAHLDTCPTCRSLLVQLETEHRLLGEHWAVAAAAVLVLATASLMTQPAALAGVGLFLRQVILRESPPDSAMLTSLRQVKLDEAQRGVPWQILQPSPLPEGYQLVAVYAGE